MHTLSLSNWEVFVRSIVQVFTAEEAHDLPRMTMGKGGVGFGLVCFFLLSPEHIHIYVR